MRTYFIFLLCAMTLVLVPGGAAHAVSLGGIFGCATGGAAGSVGGIFRSVISPAIPGASIPGLGGAIPVSDRTVQRQLDTQNIKMCVLDGLVVALRQGIITATTQGVVNWVNSGFEGGPAYVTDLNRYLGEVGDKTAEEFIRGPELAGVCTPFSTGVRVALATQRQPFQQRIECTLGDVVGNQEKFFAGDFSEGGWQAWFRVATNMQNNPYGAYLTAQQELDARIVAKQEEEKTLLSYGDGFFSNRRCVRYATPTVTSTTGGVSVTTESEPVCQEWEVATPGTVINRTLSDHLTSGLRQLELADEINEIINALLAQLSRQVITGVQGLRGLSSPSGGQGSFLQRMVDESASGARGAVADVVGVDMNRSIQIEGEYRALLEDALDELDEAERRLELFVQCGAPVSEDGDGILAEIGMKGVHSQALAAHIKERVQTLREKFLNELIASQRTTEAVSDMYVGILRAPTLNAMEPEIRAYDSFIQTGALRNDADFAAVDAEMAHVRALMQAVDLSLGSCLAAPQS